MELHQLPNMIDWTNVMKVSRSAGGHEDVMEHIFFDHAAVVLAAWVESDYQGSEVYAYMAKDGYIIVVQDSFGSCSGCDSWEGANDEDAERLIRALVDSAKIYRDIDEVLEYINNVDSGDYFGQYLINIKDDLVKYNDIYKKMVLEEAPLYINDEDKVIKFMSAVILGYNS